jgi:malonyl-CoA O-methyltransferase
VNAEFLNTIDKRLVRRSFERAAASYDSAAFLQQEIGDRLVERLDLVRLQPGTILDVGAGTGYVAHALQQRYQDSQVVVSDIAAAMLQQARRRVLGGSLGVGLVARVGRLTAGLFGAAAPFSFVAADAEALPLADASVDLLVSNLALQWCPDLDAAFAEFRRVLRSEGLLMFTTFGPDTLKELRAAWAQLDQRSHVNAFIDMHDIGDALMRAGLSEPVMDVEIMTVTYPGVLPLMKDLKAIGAHNVNAGRPRGMTGRRQLQQLEQAYEPWRRDGALPATYEVVYGHAWAPLLGGRRDEHAEPGIARVAFPVKGSPGPR